MELLTGAWAGATLSFSKTPDSTDIADYYNVEIVIFVVKGTSI